MSFDRLKPATFWLLALRFSLAENEFLRKINNSKKSAIRKALITLAVIELI